MDKEKININVWRNFAQLIRSQGKNIVFLFIIMIGVGVLDSVFPLFSKYVIDNFIAKNTLHGLDKFILIFLSIILIQGINVFLFLVLAGKIETNISYDIRKMGFEKLQLLPLSYYDKKAVGWLMARMTSDINRISETISWGLVDFSWGIAMMLAIVIAMFNLNVKLALIALTVVPPLAITSAYFQKKILKAQREVRKINSKITAAYNEDISGAKTTKVLVREDINLEEFSLITEDMLKASIRATIISSLYIPIVLVLGSIGTALVLNAGGKNVIMGSISYGTLVAFISYTMQFFEPIRQLAIIFAEVQSAQASAERVFSLLDEKPSITDRRDVVVKYGDLFNPIKENWPEIKGEIEFRNVSFAYENGKEVLKDFNLKVKPGETIALVGETGSGKSTIVNLLCRFYEPTSGKILIDGIDYKDMPQVWIHENLGYVLQTPHLFSGTIKENIKYGNLNATEEDIIRASKLANCHEFIMEMEKGYDSPVGEGGSLLSTGQKQLISFARALIRQPKILVLDEATSSIDTETEKMIQDAIEKILEGKTSFIIAHRLSTIRNANRILVIKDGKIIEEGDHETLIDRKGYYYNLYVNQFIKEKSMEILG
ncbi:ABC transporter ATP-binding protein [Tepidimicrobium xylanilyticum]|uniref:ABC transporter ATP-binding protein n=1 Tax=Tepidimicrobium xylanilyticum TaxID=1123352 RepID=UPI00264B1EC9|nr:ABC transporter ATP-binding protein [Tepidimicrobium xylanilyticum]GMG96638.1 ABC transporter ATP-binding protein [Tepidimicrobium xylanilyticum]